MTQTLILPCLWLGLLLCSNRAYSAEAYFNSNGVRIRYLDSGKGDAVILLHGFAMPSVEMMWVKNPALEPQVISTLERDFRVLAMEFRGHGQSDKPTDPKDYGPEMAEDVVRLMDHVRIKQAHVVGYSLGAAVAGKLLVVHPDRLLSVTFSGGAPVYNPDEKTVAIMKSVAESLDADQGVGPLFQMLTAAGEPPMPKTIADTLGKNLVAGQDQKVLAAVIKGVANLEVTEAELRANKVPVQFIYGSREGEAIQRINSTKELLKGAQVVVVPRGNHFNTFATAKFRKSVQAFLKEKHE